MYFDQPIRVAGFKRRRFISLLLARRAFFQVDQPTPPRGSILRHLRECGEDTNSDLHLGYAPREIGTRSG